MTRLCQDNIKVCFDKLFFLLNLYTFFRKSFRCVDHHTSVLLSACLKQVLCVLAVSHQVSVDEAVLLQVLHALADVLTHEEQLDVAQSSAVLSQEVQQAAVLHELCHDADGTLRDTHAVQLDQLWVAETAADTHTEAEFELYKLRVN